MIGSPGQCPLTQIAVTTTAASPRGIFRIGGCGRLSWIVGIDVITDVIVCKRRDGVGNNVTAHRDHATDHVKASHQSVRYWA